MPPFPHLTLVTGGARSGKSAFAEALARASGHQRRYIATAQAFDNEMTQRIQRHQLDRGPDWHTIEAPLDLAPALAAAAADTVTLIDCATLWLSNHMLADHDLGDASHSLLLALRNAAGPVIVVSNELGWGIVPENPLARAFRDEQGRLNQKLAAAADLAVVVISGLPLILKGQLPEPNQ